MPIDPTSPQSTAGTATTQVQSMAATQAATQAQAPVSLQGRNLSVQAAPLADYQQLLARQFSEGRQPGLQTGLQDVKVLPWLVAAENARCPGLQLSSFGDIDSFVGYLAGPAPQQAQQQRVLVTMRGSHENAVASIHSVAFDLYLKAGQPPSLIWIEPVSLGQSFAALSGCLALASRLKQRLPTLPAMAVLVTDSQKSPADCTIFALSAALKMADHEALFAAWHLNQLQGQLLTPVMDSQLQEQPLTPVMDEQADNYLRDNGMRIYQGQALLPPAFFKHAHSGTQLKTMIAGRGWAGIQVNKRGETLLERQARYTDDRHCDDGKTRRCSVSIEAKRQTLVQRALDQMTCLQDKA